MRKLMLLSIASLTALGSRIVGLDIVDLRKKVSRVFINFFMPPFHFGKVFLLMFLCFPFSMASYFLIRGKALGIRDYGWDMVVYYENDSFAEYFAVFSPIVLFVILLIIDKNTIQRKIGMYVLLTIVFIFCFMLHLITCFFIFSQQPTPAQFQEFCNFC